MRAARHHLEAYRRTPADLTGTVAQRMHIALARNRIFLARGLNRRIVRALQERPLKDHGEH
jgi:hypothetical protein